MEIPRCEQWHARAPLGIRRLAIKNSPHNSLKAVNDVLTELHGGPLGGHLVVNKTLNMVRQMYYWLQTRKYDEKYCRQ
jgi:hypothetical protein